VLAALLLPNGLIGVVDRLRGRRDESHE
jgi:hypothetical protein